jgi:hypothetical protein
MLDKIKASLTRLKTYCEKEDFKGWDPFDGLNSLVFRNLFYLNRNRFIKLTWIQAFKKSPVNFRRIMGVRKDYNPKGLGLFLTGYCNLYKMDPDEKYKDKINWLAGKIIELRTQGFSGTCWGYNFDWQSLAFFQPRYTPTIVASTFIGYALLDAYDITGNEEYKSYALGVCDFILKDLNRSYDSQGDFAFSYSPSDKTQVFNASLLGSRMLSRASGYANNQDYLREARRSVSFCCKNQKNDGAWSYSPLPFHQWIDSFHTGFNLECLAEYQKYSGDTSFEENIRSGLDYYLKTFFLPSGIPKYYHNAIYPVDVHAAAQLVITLKHLGCMPEYISIVDNVLSWTIDHMQSREGYFYYQKNKWYTIKIPYMRWTQAWMFLALSAYLQSRITGD